MAQVIVVGAGLGGLSAAVVLAARGHAVTVVEAAAGPGGKAGIAVFDGVEVDTGPSVLTLPELVDETFRHAGTTLADELTLRELSPGFRYVYPDGVVLDVHHRLDATLAEIAAKLGPAAEAEFAGFLAYARRVWEIASPHFILDDAPNAWKFFRVGPRKWLEFSQVDPLRTMHEAIASRVRSPHLRSLLLRYATYNGSDPRVAPATLNCIAHVEIGLGGYGLQGGVFELVRALVRVAERCGVRFEYEAPVARIRAEAGRATGVALVDGRVFAADAVVANADVGHLVDTLLVGVAHGLAPPKIASTSGWTGIYRARRQVTRAPHTVLFPDRYLSEFEDLFDHDRPPQDPTVYLCAQEACHGRVGWADAEPVFVMANAPAQPIRGGRPEALWSALRERVFTRATGAWALAADDQLLWERSPAGLEARFPGSRGALYGAASNTLLAAFQRPANRISAVPGLYLASGSAHPGGGMPLCVQSGRLAAEALIADVGVGGSHAVGG